MLPRRLSKHHFRFLIPFSRDRHLFDKKTKWRLLGYADHPIIPTARVMLEYFPFSRGRKITENPLAEGGEGESRNVSLKLPPL